MAWILARWDAGSQAAFTAKMNDTARRLGMTGTSYTDASGLGSSTTSSAADQVRLGMAAMQVPAVAVIVDMPTAVVPVAGAIRNTNTLLARTASPASRPAAHRPPGDAFSSRPGSRRAGARP